MRDDRFKIYLQRLREGKVESIEETFEPTFMGVEESELSFCSPVTVSGEASVAGENFILRLAVETEATMICAICNEEVLIPIEVPPLVHTQKLDELKSGVFQLQKLIREAILLGIPSRAECAGGECPEREHIKKYFAKEN